MLKFVFPKTAIRRYNSSFIYPQNRISRVPTFCYPGGAFFSKTAILGSESWSESGVINDADSCFELRNVGKNQKSPTAFRRAIRFEWWSIPFNNWESLISTELFCLNLTQNSSIKQESPIISIGPFKHKSGSVCIICSISPHPNICSNSFA